MSRKPPRRPTKKSEPETVTLSTRLSHVQRERIEEAAAIADCSPAKFMRDAAVRRAVDVLNSEGDSKQKLRLLARRLVGQLLNPEAAIEYAADLGQDVESLTVSYISANAPFREMDESDAYIFSHGTPSAVRPKRPHESELRQIRAAFESCGAEFGALVLEQWSAQLVGGSEYSPRLSAHELLGGGDGNE